MTKEKLYLGGHSQTQTIVKPMHVKGNLQCIRNVDLLVSELAMCLPANSRDVPGDPEGVVQASVRVQAFRGVL